MSSSQGSIERRGPGVLLLGFLLVAAIWCFAPRAPQTEVEFARSTVISLSTGDWPALQGTLGEAYASYDPQVIVEEMAELFPAETPRSITSTKVGTTSVSDGKRTTTILLRCTYEEAPPLDVTMQIVGHAALLKLNDLQVARPAVLDAPRAEAPPSESFWGQAFARLAFVTGAIFVFAFSVRECVLCLRRSNPEGGIGRAILSLVGVGGLNLDWTSGAVLFLPFQVLLGCAAASTSIFSSDWMISIAIPVGALYVWSQRRRRQQYDALKEALAGLPPDGTER